VFLLIILIVGCSDLPTSIITTPTIIRVAPLPDTDPTLTRKRYQPLIDYLAKQTGIKTELIFADTYQDLLDRFQANNGATQRFY